MNDSKLPLREQIASIIADQIAMGGMKEALPSADAILALVATQQSEPHEK